MILAEEAYVTSGELVAKLIEQLGVPLVLLMLLIYSIHRLASFLAPKIEQLVVALIAFLKVTAASQVRMEKTLERVLDILQQRQNSTTHETAAEPQSKND